MLQKTPAANEGRIDAPANDDVAAIPSAAEGSTSRVDATSRRNRLFAIFGAVLALAAVGYGSYWWFVGSHYVSNDNAYVDATSAQITPLVSAAIVEVRVKDTQHVRPGDVLIVLDDADAKLAVLQAEAQLGQVTRRVQGYFANNSALAAQIAARDAE